jgi:hypothetical protein
MAPFSLHQRRIMTERAKELFPDKPDEVIQKEIDEFQNFGSQLASLKPALSDAEIRRLQDLADQFIVSKITSAPAPKP